MLKSYLSPHLPLGGRALGLSQPEQSLWALPPSERPRALRGDGGSGDGSGLLSPGLRPDLAAGGGCNVALVVSSILHSCP